MVLRAHASKNIVNHRLETIKTAAANFFSNFQIANWLFIAFNGAEDTLDLDLLLLLIIMTKSRQFLVKKEYQLNIINRWQYSFWEFTWKI